jgi:hypothetical protein
MVDILVDYSFPCIIDRVTMYTCLYLCTLRHIGYIMKVNPTPTPPPLIRVCCFHLILSCWAAFGGERNE